MMFILPIYIGRTFRLLNEERDSRWPPVLEAAFGMGWHGGSFWQSAFDRTFSVALAFVSSFGMQRAHLCWESR
jgi:hypothetical protein